VIPTAATAQEPAVEADTTESETEDEGLSLEPERWLRYTAEEGTWMSVDVSPDGETIVFDLLGDLYTVSIDGGEATRLTSGMGFDSQPRFSPEGDRIVFVSDRSGGENVWIQTLDGTDTVQVTEGKDAEYHSPEWTPDGRYVVASKNFGLGASKLWIYHVEGGSGSALVSEPEGLRMSGAAFGPDGRRVWYAQRMGTWEYNADLPQYQIAVYDRETGETYTRTSRYGSAFRPTISPDGRWLVYGTRWEDATGLRIRDLESGDERWLAYPVTHDDQESVASRDVFPGMSFTPDSRSVVFTDDGKLVRVPLEGGSASEIPFRADVEVGIGPEVAFDYPVPDADTFTVRQIRDAVPSPGGDRLAFTALDRLYVMDLPDGTPRRLTTSTDVTEAEPTWSPDGRRIAYATWSSGPGAAGGHLYRVRADGSGDPVRLTATPALYQQPAWSPDGERIVAIRGPARAYLESSGPFAPGAADDLVWLDASTGASRSEAHLIAPVEGRRNPHFVEDEPDRIYLHHPDDGLLSIRFDGTDQKTHLKVTGETIPGGDEPMDASMITMAPRGELALAEVGWHLYAVTVPYVGGETPTVSVANPEGAAFPVRKLTELGGEFPTWSSDGASVHWSLGNAHFVYDVEAARAAEDSAEAAASEERAEEGEDVAAGGDAEDAADEADDAEDETPVYSPEETRIRVVATRDTPEGSLVLRGARVVTMVGDEVIDDADLVVEDDRISAVGPRGEVTVPEDARVLDMSGKTIVPGFVDVHAHIWPAWGIHKTQVPGYLANLAYGVTTTRDPQTSTTDVLTYGDQVEAGRMLGPRIYSTGPGVFRSTTIGSLDEARNVLKRYSEYFHTKTIKMYLAGNREQRQWIIQAAREQELTPTTEGALDMKLDLTQIIDGYPGHEHSFPLFPLHEDIDRLMEVSQTTYTPTLLVAYGGPWAENYWFSRHNPHDDAKLRRFTPHEELDQLTRRRGQWFMDEEHVFEDQARELAEIVRAGGRAGVGSHGQLQGLGYHWELWSMASGGLTNHEALRVATLMGAEAIGLAQDLGSLEEGKLADLVVLDENPLTSLEATNTISHVMKNGRLYDGDTLDEIWPRQRTLEDLYWQGQGPDGAAGRLP
jgi:Tol biopolymer transport system component